MELGTLSTVLSNSWREKLGDSLVEEADIVSDLHEGECYVKCSSDVCRCDASSFVFYQLLLTLLIICRTVLCAEVLVVGDTLSICCSKRKEEVCRHRRKLLDFFSV